MAAICKRLIKVKLRSSKNIFTCDTNMLIMKIAWLGFETSLLLLNLSQRLFNKKCTPEHKLPCALVLKDGAFEINWRTQGSEYFMSKPRGFSCLINLSVRVA